jgi:hypothetical protein
LFENNGYFPVSALVGGNNKNLAAICSAKNGLFFWIVKKLKCHVLQFSLISPAWLGLLLAPSSEFFYDNFLTENFYDLLKAP